jgi:hypothetical protein
MGAHLCLRPASLRHAGKRASAWIKLAKLSKATRDADLFVAQCPNMAEAHLLMAQVADGPGQCVVWYGKGHKRTQGATP